MKKVIILLSLVFSIYGFAASEPVDWDQFEPIVFKMATMMGDVKKIKEDTKSSREANSLRFRDIDNQLSTLENRIDNLSKLIERIEVHLNKE